MRENRFLVVDTIQHGFAVAGPSQKPGVDLELIGWGMTAESARAKVDDYNEEPKHVQRTD